MKKILILILTLSLILASGCTKSNNTGNTSVRDSNAESLAPSSVITSNTEEKDSVNNQLNIKM